MYFDAAKPWIILRPLSCAVYARRLARTLNLMREGCAPPGLPPIREQDADSAAPEEYLILINADECSKKKSFAWRAGEDRIEIYGHCLESVEAAVSDFLAALGAREDAPALAQAARLRYPLARTRAFHSEPL